MTVAPPSPPEVEIVENAVLGGRVRLRQPAKGYRAGMDAALLAAAAGAKAGDRVIEAGCGAGAVLMQMAARAPGVSLAALERDPVMAALARENAALNGADATVVEGDVAAGFRALGLEPFDLAVSNPPFFDDPGALRAPAPGKHGAWMADDGLAAWTRFLLKAVREGGRIVVVHRADRLADLLALLGETAGSFSVRPVHPFADEPAKRVLVQAIKTGKAPLRLLPPLVMHDRTGGKHAAEAEAILRGEAPLAF
ncbi:methyltransferase [Roseibacterium beibuensis]|uniref:tRNA1(Val) (adenine(37)-N6)-methyltransferase n=1 Tax=[Roseibacterium] beibuensis TaxID=1193142 RepID=UPI00217E2114|nr:methyltransferase [Roseibacterium beibuensis]MCS6625500.1 methyltransferase [Roseibacterium beibuensis]